MVRVFASMSRPEREKGSHERRSPLPWDMRHVGWEGLNGPQCVELGVEN